MSFKININLYFIEGSGLGFVAWLLKEVSGWGIGTTLFFIPPNDISSIGFVTLKQRNYKGTMVNKKSHTSHSDLVPEPHLLTDLKHKIHKEFRQEQE